MIEKKGWCYAESQEPMLAITAAENLGAMAKLILLLNMFWNIVQRYNGMLSD